MKNWIAVAKAEQVAAEYGRNPFAIARRLGFRLAYDRLPDGCEEMVLPDLKLLFLPRGCRTDPHRARVLVAHALGHHFLHCGDQAGVLDRTLPRQFFHKHEQQAEAFAVTLLYGARAGAAA